MHLRYCKVWLKKETQTITYSLLKCKVDIERMYGKGGERVVPVSSGLGNPRSSRSAGTRHICRRAVLAVDDFFSVTTRQKLPSSLILTSSSRRWHSDRQTALVSFSSYPLHSSLLPFSIVMTIKHIIKLNSLMGNSSPHMLFNFCNSDFFLDLFCISSSSQKPKLIMFYPQVLGMLISLAQALSDMSGAERRQAPHGAPVDSW